MAALKQIGGIEIFAEIGQSATTRVYKGFQPDLKRFVLLKVLRPEFQADSELVARLREEARLIAKIRHENVISVYDSGEVDQVAYLATEFVDGMDLAQLLQAGKIPVAIALFILTCAAHGLKAAHDKGILHSDIKPSNILVSYSGGVKLCDFGMAEIHAAVVHESSAEIRGTLGYFSPERLKGAAQGPHSDVFSLGVTFYEMLTGVPAFYGENSEEFIHAVVNDDPVPFLAKKELPDRIVEICKKMLAKNPAHRYPKCGELIRDLADFRKRYGLRTSQKDLAQYLADPESHSVEIHLLERSGNKAGRISSKARLYSLVILVILLTGWLVYSLPFRAGHGVLGPNKVELADQTVSEIGIHENAVASNTSGSLQPLATSGMPVALDLAGAELAVANLPVQDRALNNQGVTAPAVDNRVEAGFGFLNIICSPWASVSVDGDSIGLTPLATSVELTGGRHEIVFSNPDFPQHSRSIEIKPGDTTNLDFSFWSVVGTLHLEVSPWAEVFIDGEYRDTIPPQKRPIILPPGSHKLTLKHPNFGEWQTELEIEAGENLALQFNLRTLLSQ